MDAPFSTKQNSSSGTDMNVLLESPIPEVTIAVFTDIQYRNDLDDILVKDPEHIRSYRSALWKTEEAISAFAARSVPFVVHLGDIIDGRFSPDGIEFNIADVIAELDQVLNIFSRLPAATTICHVIGNHCLFVGRSLLQSRLQLDKSSYYTKQLSQNWRLIVLDTMDKSVLYPQEDPRLQNGMDYLNNHTGDPNAVVWNGGIGPDQLKWLQQNLQTARQENMNVLVAGHHPFAAEAASAEHVGWDSSLILDLLGEFSCTVRAYIAGHFHSGGYALIQSVHHITFPAVLDSDESNAYAFLHLHSDRIAVEGRGALGPPTTSYSFVAKATTECQDFVNISQ